MSLTDDQWRRWLSSPNARRVTLVELDHADGTEQVSDAGYLAPAHEQLERPRYAGVLVNAVGIATRIDGLIEYGNIELIDDGSITPWLNHKWRGHQVRIYLGAPYWPRGDFRQIAVAINAGRQSSRRGRIVLGVMDASSQLDTPIDTGQLPNDAGPVPLLLGQCYNVPAVRDSTTTLHYRISYLPLESVTPRVNGNAYPHTPDLAGGGFTGRDSPGGSSVTAGAHEQHGTPAAIVEWVAEQYGLEVGQVSLPDVTVGLFSSSAITGAQILDRLCQGLGAHWYIDALGQLTARVFEIPEGEAEVRLGRDDIFDGSLSLSSDEPPWSGLTLRWGRNDAPLSTLAGALVDSNPDEAERLRREWRDSNASQSLPGYPLAESQTRDSVLQIESEAASERDRLLQLYVTRREVWEVNTSRMDLQLHQTITINDAPIAGRVGRIIRNRRDTALQRATIGVWL